MCAHQLVVPRPLVFSVCGRMNTYISAACLNVPFKGCLLISIQNVASRAIKNHCMVFLQVLISKSCRIFRGVNSKAVFSAQLLNSSNAEWNAGVLPAFGL